MDATEGTVTGHRDDAVGWVVFDNPARLNALSSEMAARALEIVTEYENDPAIRVVILRGVGEKAFISGGDISRFRETRFNPETANDSRQHSESLRNKLTEMDKPVIAMIHGYCLGGGLGLALCADLRFGSTTSELGIPAALRGIAYAPAGLKKLVELVGPSAAKDMMFSGRRLKAEEALRLGLLNRVFEAKELEHETLEYARLIARNAPLSIKASKFCINQMSLEEAEQNHERMQQLQDAAANSEDFREATIAFMEKRKPVFRGR